MDGPLPSISPTDLHARIGTASAPIVVDVRRTVPSPSDRLIVSAFHQPPNEVARWSHLALGRPVVVYCRQGHDVSQGVAAALRAAGIEAAYLDGGFAGWTENGLPTRRNIGATPGKWVTRERPKIDRIACPWLIQRFIDPSADFIYVPEKAVLAVAKETGATPYDIKDPALDHLAEIVRGADTSRHDLTPQCGGLFAISLGLSANFPDDHEMLKHGMVIYDAIYTWCRSLQVETHNWPATAVKQARRG